MGLLQRIAQKFAKQPIDLARLSARARVQALTRAAMKAKRLGSRHRVATVRPDHPGRDGFTLGECAGCGAKVLIRSDLVPPAGEPGPLFLCDGACWSDSNVYLDSIYATS